MNGNWLKVVPFFLACGFLGVVGFELITAQNDLNSGATTQTLPSAQEGRTAPPLNLTAFEDIPNLRRIDLEGNGLIILNFWASWCPPCRAEHPTLTELAAAGNPLFGVNYRDNPSQARNFLQELGNPFDRLGTDSQARNGRDWGVVAMPETFFINDEGTVILHFRGPITRRALVNQIIPTLAAREERLEIPPSLMEP